MSKSEKKIFEVVPEENREAPSTPIEKPKGFDLNRFKSTHADAIANVGKLQGALPHHPLSQAKDFVRLHPNENEYWSVELCFVNVPCQGQKRDTLHLIIEELAMKYLPSARIQRFRLALASKPFNAFFLCHVPTRNLDNSWNISNLDACEKAKHSWTIATSRKGEGVDGYDITFAKNPKAFADPEWTKQTLNELIGTTFNGRIIDREDHPALLRLLGDVQDVAS
jgi:hypothetical protein